MKINDENYEEVAEIVGANGQRKVKEIVQIHDILGERYLYVRYDDNSKEEIKIEDEAFQDLSIYVQDNGFTAEMRARRVKRVLKVDLMVAMGCMLYLYFKVIREGR
ncbi:MAG: hypothetical protein IJ867_01025 [Clostridia bacterium]|nr:hypothetical protein [Clostridia bacterium]